MVKTKNRNHSMNKVKNLGYNRWLILIDHDINNPAKNQIPAVFHSRVINYIGVLPKFIELCIYRTYSTAGRYIKVARNSLQHLYLDGSL